MSFWVLFRFRGKESALVRHDQILPAMNFKNWSAPHEELQPSCQRSYSLTPSGSATDSNCRINRRKNLQASAVTKIGEYQFKAPHCEAQHVIANFEKPQPLARISGQARKSASGGAELFIRLPVQ